MPPSTASRIHYVAALISVNAAIKPYGTTEELVTWLKKATESQWFRARIGFPDELDVKLLDEGELVCQVDDDDDKLIVHVPRDVASPLCLAYCLAAVFAYSEESAEFAAMFALIIERMIGRDVGRATRELFRMFEVPCRFPQRRIPFIDDGRTLRSRRRY